MTLRRIALTMIAVAAFFIALWIVLDFLVDWLWFSTLGYLGVFLTTFAAKAASSSLCSRHQPLSYGSTAPWRIGSPSAAETCPRRPGDWQDISHWRRI